MTDGSNPFLITPPPGLLPPARESREAMEPDVVASIPAITLPGIVSDSATVRVNPPREPVSARPPASGGIPFTTPSAGPAPAVEVSTAADDETRIVRPGSQVAPTWRLTLPDAQTLVVESALYIGRNPVTTMDDVAGSLLPVADTTKSVSKTHALLTVDSAGLWVTDLDSTNGVYVAHADGTGEQAEPGEALAVPPGSDLVLGEFVIQVELG